MSIDLPGVKLPNIVLEVLEESKLQLQGRRKMNDDGVKQYEQTFVFDTHNSDLTSIKAEL